MIKLFNNVLPRIKNVKLFSSSTMTNPVVTVKGGKLRGAVKQLNDGSTYYSFKGIRYAQPPIGDLRFKAPLPPLPWTGIQSAIEHGPVCPQIYFATQIIEDGSEDCLFLNVYTQSLDTNKKVPVMVYFHGGGFASGSGNTDIYGPEFLLQHNVVVVTVNYRLEVFGFLCLDIPEVPGNAGMKDQVAALQWVRENIPNFGGDIENITIFGESAGGASVTYHMLSPLSKGLFQKVIAQSGVCLLDWALDIDGRERAFRVGKYFGKDTKDPKDLLQFLQSVPATDLIQMTTKSQTKEEKIRGLPLRFVPVVEKFDDSAFLTEKPVDLMRRGEIHRVPVIVGYNSMEGLMMAKPERKRLQLRNQIPSSLVPRELSEKITEDKLKDFGDRIKNFYYPNKELTPEDVEIIAYINTDLHFVHGIYRFAELYSKFCKTVFMYRFDLDTELNYFKRILGYQSYKGACHVDEVFYLFQNEMNKDIYEEQQKIRDLIYMVTKLWTDFAKTGNPTPDDWNTKWDLYSTNKEYLRIEEPLSMGKGDEEKRLQFWTNLYKDADAPSIIKSKI